MAKEVTALKVDPTNTEQAKAWDGNDGGYWADNADRFDRAIARHHAPFMAAANISAHDRVLDIGCGTGQTTREAARAARSGSALGVDLSARMINRASEIAAREGLANASFEQGDAQIHPFQPGDFDVAISRTGAMFFGDPVAAFTNIATTLGGGGRLVLLTWQGIDRNEWLRAVRTAMAGGRELPNPPTDTPGPFSLSDPERVRTVLEAGGFTDIQLEPRSDAIWLGDDAASAERFLLDLFGGMLDGLDDKGRLRALDDLRATLVAHETDQGVIFGSATWTTCATRK